MPKIAILQHTISRITSNFPKNRRIFLVALLQNRSMIVCTATLLFMLLIFAPIRVRLDFVINLSKFTGKLKAKVCKIPVFSETAELVGKYLNCSGTVDTMLDVTTFDKQNGIDIAESITVDKICLSMRNNVATVFYPIAFENVVACIAAKFICEYSHCKFYCEVIGCVGDSSLAGQIDLNVSVAELSFCLLKQGVRQWTRKSVK